MLREYEQETQQGVDRWRGTQDAQRVNVDDHPYLRHLQEGFSGKLFQLNEY